MGKSILAIFFGLSLTLSSASWAAPSRENYEATPFWLDGQTIPQVMLVLERDWKIFYPAYNNLTDLDGDGIIDIGFNPNVTYVGYFDSDSCYSYSGGTTTSGMFSRVGPTRPQTATELEALIPRVIKDLSKDTTGDGIRDAGVRVPLSKHGVCNRSQATIDGAGQWHGNWLNFATTSRMDAIRKVLYGGKRYIDTTSQTVLELTSYLPANSHVWGGELPADNIWYEFAKTSPWYDIPSFTGYIRPADSTMHFWARSSYYTPSIVSGNNDGVRTYSSIPLFQVAANVPTSNWHPLYKTPVRIWDWVGDHGAGSLPDDHNIIAGPNTVKAMAFATASYANKPANQAARRFNARVEACKPGNMGEGEGCRQYSAGIYKPAGLLQQYGENEKMFFGLLTGTIHPTTRYEGGVVRHHIQKFDNYVDSATGLIIRPGLIDTIDRLQVTGIGTFTYGGTTSHSEYADGTQAGNPLGEMVYEAVRYFARNYDYLSAASNPYLSPTSSYVPSAEASMPAYNSPTSRSQLPRLTNTANWSKDQRPVLTTTANDCPKPIILVLSEVYPDHDFNSSLPNSSDLNDVPLMTEFKETVVPKNLDIDAYLDIITETDKLSTAAEGKQFFFPEQPRGICKPGNLTGGLKSIKGHCPSEPSLEGSYSIAAVAYYAHTHDLFNLKGSSGQDQALEKNIDLYAVGIPGNFPDITFAVDEKRTLTLMPITVAKDKADADFYVNSVFDGDMDKSLLRTLINFYIESWEMDSSARMFRVKFATNFEFNTTPSWSQNSGSNNMERDVLNRFEIVLLTTAATPMDYRESKPIYINSGPLRTKDRTNSSEQRYYAFRNPNPNQVSQPLDITKYEIVGVAIQNSTHGSYINMVGNGGYTISGVKNPGAYIDAGYCGGSYYKCPGSADAGTTPIITVGYDFVPMVFDVYGDYLDYYASNSYYEKYISKGLPPNHGNNIAIIDNLLTPWECPYAGYTNGSNDPEVLAAYGFYPDATQVCGKNAAPNKLMRYYQVRSFKFDENATGITHLPNPLWLAAKYGGFKDANGNGLPDLDSEWKRGGTGSGSEDPYNYFGVANITELPTQLGNAFEAISNSVATGTANASSLNSVLDGGLSIQTQYRTEYTDPADPTNKLKWVGSVYAFFVDKWGNLRADTTGDKMLQVATSPDPSDWPVSWGPFFEKGDLIVHSVSNTGKGLPTFYLCRDPKGNNNGGFNLPTDKHPPINDTDPLNGYPPTAKCRPVDSLDMIDTVWNASKQLSNMNVSSRTLYSYFGDQPADGSESWPGSGGLSLTPYKFNTDNVEFLHRFMGQDSESATFNLINYIRGLDYDEENYPELAGQFRNRTAVPPWSSSGPKVWRMADVINSKPVIVGEPGGRYHLTYGDRSFAAYASGASAGGVAQRRQVAYFGSNDGILHAVNLGFFGSVSGGYATYDQGGAGQPELGDELWGYIPTAVLPHLQWLAKPDYNHGYYVDFQPHIADIKDSSGNWRTVMIVGLRLGGNSIEMVNNSNAVSYCEYFALDVTDPESPPKLMWRFSAPHLGLTTAKPAVVRSGSNWYVALPSGPTSDEVVDGQVIPNSDRLKALAAYSGTSTQNARVFVLNAFSGNLMKELEVPEANSFFNDTYLPRANYVQNTNSTNATWSHHVVYMGLSVAKHDQNQANKENYGALYRLKMADENGNPLPVSQWALARMFNTEKPITGAVNSTYDNLNNLWVVFGTGRIWSKDDLIPCGALTEECCDNHTQYFYGLKEPVNEAGFMTYEEIREGDPKDLPIVDVSDINVYENGVLDTGSSPVGFTYYDTLYQHMIAKDDNGPVVRGYKRKLETWTVFRGVDSSELSSAFKQPTQRGIFELINTQPKIDGLANGRSNTVVTVYQTTDNICDPTGQSFLYMFDTFTGLPAPYMSAYSGFATGATDSSNNSQVTGIKSSGVGIASEAWIMKTADGTIYGNTSFNSSRNTVFAPGGLVSGFMSWREVLDMNFDMGADEKPLYDDLLTNP